MSKFEQFKSDEMKNIKNSNKKFHEKLDNFVMINHRKMNLGFVELFNNVVFHALDTVKVRIQAKSHFEDVANYLKNRVFEKRKK
jgi:hypothetical protein